MQARLLFPEAEATRSLYKKVLKYNQVTYGVPFQVNIPLNIKKIEVLDNEDISSDEKDGRKGGLYPDPEELLEKAEQERELIIKNAEAEAEKLLEKAELEADKKAEALFNEAWKNGYADGMEAARSQNEALLDETEKLRQSAAEEHDSILAGMETEILELVVDIARKVVAGELETNRNVILQLVRDGLSCCSNNNGAVIKVSPEDYEHLKDNEDGLSLASGGAEGLEIKKDSMLNTGECIIDTSLGSIDAGVNTRLKKIEEAFREQL